VALDWSFGGLFVLARGQEATKTAGPAAYETPFRLQLSLDVSETYDDNVYLSGVDARYLPASYTVPRGSVAALAGLSSFVTTVSPRIAVDLAPLFGNQHIVQAFSLAYAPDFLIYHQRHSEDYDAHRFPIAIKGGSGAFSFSAVSNLAFIDGSSMGPTFPGALLNSYATITLRMRRKQIDDLATVALQYDNQRWFVRPTASLLYYGMMSALLNVVGYQNYISRYDVNGGIDLGYRLDPSLAVTLGYRDGHQYQQQLSFSRYSSPSDYQQVLLGVEGRPWPWLQVKIEGGPDFRDYPSDTPTHITPVNDKRSVYYYGDASLSAAISADDRLVFRYKGFQWVSQLGSIPYYDSVYDLIYHRSLGQRWGFDVEGSVLSADYTSGNLVSSRRDDLEYNASATLGYALNAHASADLAYVFDAGRNDQAGVVYPQTRAFDRHLISVKTAIKF
jgi:hypothetical protein